MVVDCQSHVFEPRWLEHLAARASEPRAVREETGWRIEYGAMRHRLPAWFTDIEAKLRAMDAAGIDMALLTPNLPGPETCGSEGVGLARRVNDWVAERVAAHPDRFALVVTPPLNDVDAPSRRPSAGHAAWAHARSRCTRGHRPDGRTSAPMTPSGRR